MKRLITFLSIGLGLLAARSTQAQPYTFDSSFSVSFPDGVANQVAYINFPTYHYWGNIEVSITGGYNYQNTKGLVSKRYMLIKNAGTPDYFDQQTEVLAASGNMANQWALGDFDAQNFRIPIYHLTNTGNLITVKIAGTLIYAEAVDAIKRSLAVASPVVVPNQATRQYMSIQQERVGIGTFSPDARLTVAGTVHAKEVRVDQNIPVPDYVFEDNYMLPELSSIKDYVRQNHHLPEIPSAAQIAKEGITVGEMNMKLLKKVEELTLYLISQQDDIKSLRETVKCLEDQLSRK
ncbi:hypothetical protein GS399_05430 [Pedobacter sp. HMF7647]|uniref:Uncharacterized protein n=1 Tax=Hufsiella arboris TaxID=2695275 RepID=A0A7K1Y763_9SPHI|nr:hypothetical protein [Hufsiella arboris]MXV50407.1 hypothetical protein [Hufsiella arboris]